MPLKNEHSARQLPPKKFDDGSIKRKNISNGISLLVGRLTAGKKYAVQSVRASADEMSIADFRNWLTAHSYKVDQLIGVKKSSEMKAVSYSEVVTAEPKILREAPEGLTVGSPFKTLSLGSISSRMTGDEIGEITPDLMKELVRVYRERKGIDPVIIDWCHASGDDQAPIDNTISLGEIVDMYVEGDCLWCVPAYSERGLKLVEETTPLWSSPEFLQGNVFDRRDGSKIGNAQILAISLTPRPQQTADKLTRITLEEDSMENEGMTGAAGDASELESLRAEKEALEGMVEQLRSEIESLKASQLAEGDSAEEDEKEESTSAAEEIEEEEKEKVELRERVLLSEQQGQIRRLSDELATIRRERKSEQRQAKIRRLCELGKITPAEVPQAERLYDLDKKLFAEMFEGRIASSAVNLGEYGHGYGSPEIPTRATVDGKVKKLSEKRGISYADALTAFRNENRDEYLSAMKGVN